MRKQLSETFEQIDVVLYLLSIIDNDEINVLTLDQVKVLKLWIKISADKSNIKLNDSKHVLMFTKDADLKDKLELTMDSIKTSIKLIENYLLVPNYIGIAKLWYSLLELENILNGKIISLTDSVKSI